VPAVAMACKEEPLQAMEWYHHPFFDNRNCTIQNLYVHYPGQRGDHKLLA
jgi:hypothetical protein